MRKDRAIARYRRWYRKLLGNYSKSHRERFGASMEQTFCDLLAERLHDGRGLLSCVLWVFLETAVGILRENFRSVIMQITTGTTGSGTIAYRAGLGIAAATALLQILMHFALGTEDDNSGGLLFAAPIVCGVGAIVARLRPQAMVGIMVVTALAQAAVAAIAMIAWQQYLEFAILNGGFIAFWLGAAALFRRAAGQGPRAEATAA